MSGKTALVPVDQSTVSVMDMQGQQRRVMICLPLDCVNGRLFGISAVVQDREGRAS
jgi:hypothetical protein